VCVACATRAPPWKTLTPQFITYRSRNSVQSNGASSSGTVAAPIPPGLRRSIIWSLRSRINDRLNDRYAPGSADSMAISVHGSFILQANVPVTGARPRTQARHGDGARVRVDWAVSGQFHLTASATKFDDLASRNLTARARSRNCFECVAIRNRVSNTTLCLDCGPSQPCAGRRCSQT